MLSPRHAEPSTTFFQTAPHAANSDESTVCPPPHTWAHRWSQLASVSVIGRRVSMPSLPPESMAKFDPLSLPYVHFWIIFILCQISYQCTVERPNRNYRATIKTELQCPHMDIRFCTKEQIRCSAKAILSCTYLFYNIILPLFFSILFIMDHEYHHELLT